MKRKAKKKKKEEGRKKERQTSSEPRNREIYRMKGVGSREEARRSVLLPRDSRVSFQRGTMWHFNALFQPAKSLICKTRSRSGHSFAISVCDSFSVPFSSHHLFRRTFFLRRSLRGCCRRSFLFPIGSHQPRGCIALLLALLLLLLPRQSERVQQRGGSLRVGV